MKMIRPALLFFLLILSAHADSTINAANKYAYGANVGWINLRGDTTNGACIGEFVCSNYLYGANIGWIDLGDGTPNNGWSYGNTTPTDFGVNHDGKGHLLGYAWGANVGWIVFETNGNPRVDLATGAMDGYIWGQNIGWISLSNAFAYVQIDRMDSRPDTDGNGIPDDWEYWRMGSLGYLYPLADYDGDGVLDPDEYGSDTDPGSSNSFLRITQYVRQSGTNILVTWASTPSRMYRIEYQTNLISSATWTDSGMGSFAPDGGLAITSTRNLATEGMTQKTVRVRAIRPLR